MDPDHRDHSLIGLAVLALGVWLFTSPFVLGIDSAGQWHLYFWGAALALLGGYEAARAARGHPPVAGVAVGVLVVGLWVAVSPLVYTYPLAATWSNAITGVLLAAAGTVLAAAANRRVTLRRA